MKTKRFHILFFSSEPPDGSSTIHRCNMMGKEMKEKYDIDYDIISEREKKRGEGNQVFPSIKSYIKTLLRDMDITIIHRSSSFMAYYLLKLMKLRKIPIIYDYDDALFERKSLQYTHINLIIKESNAVTAGSHYLFDYSKKLNKNTLLLPTPVDTELFHPRKKRNMETNYVTIGWLGAGTELQLPYLRVLKKPLKILAQKYDIKLKIVSALSEKVRAEFRDLGFKVDFGLSHWVPLDRVPDLISDFDIGVMPLTDDPFSRGKCAMKALEYMAMEIPAVVSNVGENQYIIKNGVNGFLASSVDEWVKQLGLLIEDRSLRRKMGKKARKTVENKYSLNVCGKKMRDLIQELSDRKC